MLAKDVALYAAGGVVRSAALRTVIGIGEVTMVHAHIAEKFRDSGPSLIVRDGLINGLPGFVSREPDGILQTTAFLIEEGRIAAIYIMRNPDKLRHLESRAGF